MLADRVQYEVHEMRKNKYRMKKKMPQSLYAF